MTQSLTHLHIYPAHEILFTVILVTVILALSYKGFKKLIRHHE